MNQKKKKSKNKKAKSTAFSVVYLIFKKNIKQDVDKNDYKPALQ